MIIRTRRQLEEHYADLQPGDTVLGLLAPRHLREPYLLDLLQRGVRCLPAPLAQVLNRSKTAQAQLLAAWMLPHTRVISRRHDLLDAANVYQRNGVETVVCKLEHRHCGQGVLRWDSIEHLYNHVSLVDTAYPFVLQPFIEAYADLRLIVVADYREVYYRSNPANFRNNLARGGSYEHGLFDADLLHLCTQVMERGGFPYAHLDVMRLDDGRCFLSEISLNGGLHGARISARELGRLKQNVLEGLANPPQNL